MNTGHEGSLSTCHANSPADALRRLETMVLMSGLGLALAAVRDQVTSSLDLVVQVARRRRGARRIVEVAEVEGPCRVRRLGGEAGLQRLPLRLPRSPLTPAASERWLGS